MKMKKIYALPEAEIMHLSTADSLLFSEDTEISDEEGWLTQEKSNGANNGGFGVR